jgi:hypothetical protein
VGDFGHHAFRLCELPVHKAGKVVEKPVENLGNSVGKSRNSWRIKSGYLRKVQKVIKFCPFSTHKVFKTIHRKKPHIKPINRLFHLSTGLIVVIVFIYR